ncbi:MAG: acyl-CoA desaturase [Candidatus Kapaibacteriales bacterium]
MGQITDNLRLLMQKVRFVNRDQTKFFTDLKGRVNGYFKENQISKNADYRMVLKTITLVGGYLALYSALFFITPSYPLLLCLGVLTGFFYSGIGMSVMHDANHGAYSRSAKWNRLIGGSIYLLGANRYNWVQKHNVMHHTFTNIDGLDEDLDNGGLIRLSDQQPRHKMHRFQHLYAWFLYGLITLTWITTKDFKQLQLLKEHGFGPNDNKQMNKEIGKVVVGKIFYYAYFIAAPLIFTDITIGQFIVYFLAMHYTSGFILSIIFQLAHIVEPIEYPEPNESNTIENSWAVHQLATTADFARNSWFLNWYCGGLNYQVEHHLFPNICHIHYHELSKVVEDAAKEYGVPYNGLGTFGQAVASHYRQLKRLSYPVTENKNDHDDNDNLNLRSKEKQEPILA